MVAGAGLSAPALADAVRRELSAGRRAAAAPAAAAGEATSLPPPPPDLARLLALPRERFVATAYATLLGREPDEDGARHYGALLDAGRAGRIRILGALAGSAEGRRRAVSIPGLARRLRLQRVYDLPVLGRLARLATALPSVPSLMRDAERQQEQLHRLDIASERARLDRIADRDALADLDAIRRGLAARLDRLGREMFELRAAADRLQHARDDLPRLAARSAEADAVSRRVAALLADAGLDGPVLALDADRRPLARRLEAAGLDGRIASGPGEAVAAVSLDPLGAASLAAVTASLAEAADGLRPGGALVLANTPAALVGALLPPALFAPTDTLPGDAAGLPSLLVARRR